MWDGVVNRPHFPKAVPKQLPCQTFVRLTILNPRAQVQPLFGAVAPRISNGTRQVPSGIGVKEGDARVGSGGAVPVPRATKYTQTPKPLVLVVAFLPG